MSAPHGLTLFFDNLFSPNQSNSQRNFAGRLSVLEGKSRGTLISSVGGVGLWKLLKPRALDW